MAEAAEVVEEARYLYNEGLQLLKRIEKMKETQAHIEGLGKFHKKTLAEDIIDFRAKLAIIMENVDGKTAAKKDHVTCSNIWHYKAVMVRLELDPSVVAVCKVFHFKDNKDRKRVEVDLVAEYGAAWVKVKAMRASLIQRVFHGASSFGQKDVLEIAKDLISAANENEHLYKIPQLWFDFSRGITEDVAEELESQGVTIKGPIYEDEDIVEVESNAPTSSDYLAQKVSTPGRLYAPEVEKSAAGAATEAPNPLNLVNLDITTLIVLVSHVTNGGADVDFEDPILREQAVEERKEACLPSLHKFLQGKELICTEAAWKRFWEIALVVAGPGEMKRTEELRKRIRLVADDPSERIGLLKGPKVKPWHRIIFGTADKLHAVTATANISLVRSAAQQGLRLATFVHPARALTEQKATEKVAAAKPESQNPAPR